MTVADKVFDAVRNDIITGAVPRGAMLSIYQLAEQYKVSRTPVREAVLKLANLGLVTIEKNHGVRVKGLTANDVRDIFRTRIMLEVPAAYHAAQSDPPGVRARFADAMATLEAAASANDLEAFVHADRELHDIILSWTGNQRVAKIVAQIRDETHGLGASTFRKGRSIREVLAEHVPIYEAIRDGEAVLAATEMKTHLEKTAGLVLTQLARTEATQVELGDIQSIIFLEL